MVKSFTLRYVGGFEFSILSKSLKTAVNLFGFFDDILFIASCTKINFSSGIHTSPSNIS